MVKPLNLQVGSYLKGSRAMVYFFEEIVVSSSGSSQR